MGLKYAKLMEIEQDMRAASANQRPGRARRRGSPRNASYSGDRNVKNVN